MAVKHTAEVTITDLTDGKSVTLTSYSASWKATTSTRLGAQQVATTRPQAYVGDAASACTIGSCTRSDPTNCTVSVNSTGDNATWPLITITVGANATVGGTVTIPVIIGSGDREVTFDQVFTYSIALKGDTPEITASKSGTTTSILADGTEIATIEDGSAGINQATVYLYQRANSVSAPASGNSTYTFSTATLNNPPSGWTQTFPAETQGSTTPVWMIAAVASSTGATDTIPYTEWSTPVKMVSSGSNGTEGYNQATIFLYKRSPTTNVAKPTGSTTYTFSTGALSSVPSGWSRSVPDGTDPLYVTQAVAVSRAATYTIASSAWTTPTKLAEDGDNPYTLSITSSNGTVFRNGSGSTTLACHIFQAGAELASVPSGMIVRWYKNGGETAVGTGLTITVSASDVDYRATYACSLEDS